MSSDEETVAPTCSNDLVISSDDEEVIAIAPRFLRCPPNGVMLGSDYILQAIEILKAQFQDIGGLVDTILFQTDLTCEINLNLKQRKSL